MQPVLLALVALLLSLNIYASEVPFALSLDEKTQDFVTRENEQTGEVELQAEDGSWMAVTALAEAAARPATASDEIPHSYTGTGLLHQVGYYGEPDYNLEGRGFYSGPLVPSASAMPPVILPSPLYYPAYPSYTPHVYWNNGIHDPYSYYRGGGYQYFGWRRW